MLYNLLLVWLAVVTFLGLGLFMYKRKNQKLNEELNDTQVENEQMKTELEHVQINKEIVDSTRGLSEPDVDERMREQGYFRHE